MAVKYKVLSIALVFMLVLGIYVLRAYVILPSFVRLEEAESKKDLSRCVEAIDRETYHLGRVASDWATWDSTYAFIQGHNDDYLESNIDWEGLEIGAKVNFIYYYDSAGAKVWGEAFFSAWGGLIALKDFSGETMAYEDYFSAMEGSSGGAEGLLLTEHGPMLVVSRPIRRTGGGGPVRGTLLLGRFLHNEMVETLQSQTRVDFSLEDLSDDEMAATYRPVIEQLEKGGFLVAARDYGMLWGYALLKDIHGEPALLLKAMLPRSIMAEGRVAARLLTLSMILASMSIGLILLIWLRSYLASTRRYTEEIEAIVTQRTRDLHDSEERFRDIALSSADFIWEVDLAGRYTYVAGRAEAITGFSRSTLIGRSCFDILGPGEKVRLFKTVRKLVAEEKIIHEMENWILTPDGRSVCVRTNAVPKRNTDGKLVGYRGLNTDISEKKKQVGELLAAQTSLEETNIQLEDAIDRANRLTAEAQQANLAKSEFLANMSHEIRTPLNGVVGNVSLLMRSPVNEKQAGYIEGINSASEALLALINNILDFSKIEAGGLELEDIPVKLSALIDDVLAILRPRAEGRSTVISATVGQDVPGVIRGDPGRLRQILLNLCTNAIKFTEAGRVTVGVTRASGGDERAELRFEVQDTGIGISPDDRKLLFSSFTQADSSTTRKYGGTGLGLAISKRLVEAMDGTIGIESEPGVGSTFWFTVTLGVVDTTLESDHPKGDGVPSVKQRPDAFCAADYPPILVAEDNPLNQELIQFVLEEQGYTADIVENGEEALEALASKNYGMVLMDCQMPRMDGYAATKIIRKKAYDQRSIPIVAMTANALSGDREACIAAGMSDYIAKPMKIEELLTVVERWLPSSEDDSPLPSG